MTSTELFYSRANYILVYYTCVTNSSFFWWQYFQKDLPLKHETDHDEIINRAIAIKYNPRKMKK